MAKPVKIEYYETATGPVKTLAEWKSSGVFELLKAWKDSDADNLQSNAFNSLVECVIHNADALVGILSIKETGKQNGRRDSKPRKKVSEPSVVQAA